MPWRLVVRMKEIFASAEDTEIDVPRIWQYLAQVLGPMVQVDGAVPLSFLVRATESVRLSRKVSQLITDVLHSAASRLVRQTLFIPVLNVTPKFPFPWVPGNPFNTVFGPHKCTKWSTVDQSLTQLDGVHFCTTLYDVHRTGFPLFCLRQK